MPIYNVTYSVTRSETYTIEAESEQDAIDRAFEEGEEMENASDTTDVSTGEAELADRYEVQTLHANGEYENVWREDAGIDNPEGTPVTFATMDDADAAIRDHIIDCINAVEGGEMEDSPDRSDFRIVPVKAA